MFLERECEGERERKIEYKRERERERECASEGGRESKTLPRWMLVLGRVRRGGER